MTNGEIRQAGTDAPTVELSGVSLRYDGSEGPRAILDEVGLRLGPGEVLHVQGPSGSGKTTLLNVVAGLLTPDAGTVHVLGEDMAGLPEARRAALRRKGIGIVYQQAHLVGHLTMHDNVAVGAPTEGTEWQQYADELYRLLGLTDLGDQPVAKLSGGEQQRVALVRALVRRPALIITDEPVSNLDLQSASVVQELLTSLVDDGASLVFAAHQPWDIRVDQTVELSA